jgi:vitellogenic carboxypeptidase-like protein
MTGCFEENIGPFDLHNNQTLTFNNFTWIQDTHVLFIDQPLGTGWSFPQDDGSYATNEQQVSLDLYNGLIAFFNLHPQYNNCDLYITGESYAGKYIPELALRILTTQSPDNILLNKLKGVAVGDGFSAPIIQRIIKGDQAYWSGLLSKKQNDQLKSMESECIRHIQSGNTTQIGSPCEDLRSFLLLASGIINIYDLRRFDPTTNKTRLETFLNANATRQAIHVSLEDSGGLKTSFVSCDKKVYHYLRDDILKDVRYIYPILAMRIKVVLYNGNFDLQDGPIGTEQYIQTIANQLGQYENSERNLWFVDGEVAGYEQTYGNFTFISAFGSGHYYPHDQKRNARALVSRHLINGKPYCTPGQSIPIKFITMTPATYLKYLKDPQTGEYRLPCDIHQLICKTMLKNCNGNGQCMNGICQCKPGFTGEQCSHELKPLNVMGAGTSSVLIPQEWRFYNISLANIPKKNLLRISLQWKNSKPQTIPLAQQVGEGIGNNNPSGKICVYGKKNNLPTWNSFDFVNCEQGATSINFVTNVDLSNRTSGNQLLIGVFNAQPNNISYTFSYVQDFPDDIRPINVFTSYKFWIVCFVTACAIAAIGVGSTFYYKRKAEQMRQKFGNDNEMTNNLI